VAALPGSGQAIAFWAAQIAFNTLWTPVFFGLGRMGAALVVLGGLWLFVAATMIAFWALDPVAGWLFVPYLAWVTAAGALNLAVWRLNPDAPRPARA
jgi:tryptophan-rich sensory protein